jgi:hypothetical protein
MSDKELVKRLNPTAVNIVVKISGKIPPIAPLITITRRTPK